VDEKKGESGELLAFILHFVFGIVSALQKNTKVRLRVTVD